jgi:Family of unknown function (DUF5677)
MIRDAPPAVERVEVDLDKIAAFETEEEFTSLAVSLMVEVASYSCVAAATLGASRSWDRDRAAVGGNMVRLYKLLDSFLDQTCKRRGEITWILGRLIFETAVNIRYLIANFSKELIDSYVKQALRQERRLFDVVQANISERGSMLPIEDRMLKSIDRAARAAGVSLEDVDPTDGRPWGGKNIYEKTNEVGLRDAYVAAFGGGSQSVHGNWNEVYASHLYWDESAAAFTPNTEWRKPRPQVSNALALVVLGTIKLYFDFMAGEDVGRYFTPLLSDLRDRIRTVAEVHEAYLSGKRWPEI